MVSLDPKKNSLPILFSLIFALVILLLFSYQIKSNQAIEAMYDELEHNGNYKAKQIDHWFYERQADTNVFAHRPVLAKELYEGRWSDATKARVTKRLIEVQQAYGYGLISLTDHNGRLLASSASIAKLAEHATDLVAKSIQNKIPYHSSLIYDEKGLGHLDFVAPLIHRLPDGETVAVGAVVFHMDPNETILGILQEWPKNYRSAFTGILEKQGQIYVRLNTEPDKKDMVRQKMSQPRIQQQLSKIHARIHQGELSGRMLDFVSHQEQEVLLFYRQLKHVDWFLVSRIDKQEVLAEVWAYLILLSVLGGLFILSIYLFIMHKIAQSKVSMEVKHAKQIQESQKHYFGLFLDAPMPYQSLNDEGYILNVNLAWSELFGYSVEEAKGKHFSEFITPESVPTMEKNFPRFLESGIVKDVHFKIVTKSGKIKDTILEGRISNDAQKAKRTHCTLIDITEKAEREKQLQLAQEVFTNLGEGVMVTDANCQIISVNQAFETILGYSAHEVLGKQPTMLQSGRHDKVFYQKMWQVLNDKGVWQGEIWNRKKEGELVPELLTISSLKDAKGIVQNYVGVFADISLIKSSQAELDHVAHHDLLTGLPNRRKFLSALEFSIQHAKREKTLFAVMMMDLDLFKNINDSYGHPFGDEVLMEVSKRLKVQTREIDVLSRLGGDEFVFLLENLESSQAPARIAQNMIAAIEKPIELSNGASVQISSSFGISLFPTHGKTTDELLQQADSALYLAKQKGRGAYEYYSSDLTQKAQDRMLVESELRTAIKQGDLRVYFQPQVNVDNGRVESAEALVRWQHPEMGVVSPAQFIPVAEESNLIIDIGEWVLFETCRQAKVWLDAGHSDFTFAVNVSAKQVMHSDLYGLVVKVLKETDLPPEMLELEITETGLIHMKDEESIVLFEKLRGLGVTIAIDDFGTGYSSLSYLQRLTFDVLKIDKKFVDAIPSDEKGMQIVNTIISMAKNLHLKVLAEGVETETQLDFLTLKHCDYYQGFLTSQPIKAEEFEELFLKPARPH